ncbi:LytTR family transcriptional regulator [Bradyrhizobium jicamae]|uniref:LytTR family transcriptional regulator n=1 Tax=Bradyrhizobium jicamae TaxID=280332 RepID=A0ABS5FW04_9BRAD|nr:LytTR family DNA-binding domain-containing protein [Bradyrhizobium jicamae]MBR0800905.1 LytTR family transcriptional regulator [Bradyrhizobium jicamae]
MSDVKNAPENPGVEPVWDQNQASWDESSPRGTNGWLRGMTGRDLRFYAPTVAIALTVGLVNALTSAQDSAWRGNPYDLRTPLLWEMSSVAVIILLSPILLAAVRRMRRLSGWPLRIALAATAIVVFSALHILGMVVIRKLALLLAGGSYDFHLSVTTLLYEFRKDVLSCVLIGGTFWLFDERLSARQAPLTQPVPQRADSDAEPAPAMIWLRDGATRTRIEARDLISVSSAGNYVEYSLTNGSSHLIRGTLAAAESELARFNLTRIHRTRLVNLDRVTAVAVKPSGDFELTFDNGLVIQGSRRYRGALVGLDRAHSAN